MNALNILSGGAAQGLVTSLAPQFKTQTGLDISGEFGAVGAGEAAHGPVTAAIANAVFDALGVRVRDLPITRESLIAAMEASS